MSREINQLHQEIFDKACELNDQNLVYKFIHNVELSNGLLIAQTNQNMDIVRILCFEINNREEKIKTRNKKKLLVKYDVKGFDHSGYCSDAKVSEEPRKWKHMEIVETCKYDDDEFMIDSEKQQILEAHYLEDFKTKKDGCTYTPYKIYWIKNKIDRLIININKNII
jgi:hypothetical protein